MTTIRSRAALVASVLVFLLAAPLAALAASGDLDLSFDTDGKVTTDIAGSGQGDYGRAVAIQADGKIVAAGWCGSFCLARYNSNGSLDGTFGTGGTVTGPAGEGQAVAIQADGKVVLGGSCGATSDFCLARYNSNGSLDTAFGTGGQVITAFGTAFDILYGIAIQADGKIVAAGQCNTGSGYDFCLARYDSNGSLDSTFGTGGKVTTAIGTSSDEGRAVAIQGDGRIVVAGSCLVSGAYDFCLARYNSNGSLDSAFDGDGKLITPIGAASALAWAVAIQANGKIVVAGSCAIGSTLDFCLARYDTNGSLDGTFGSAGKVTTGFGTRFDVAFAVAIQGDAKIVVAGQCIDYKDFILLPDYFFCLARYNGDGSLDATFGSGGTVATPFGTSDASARSVAVQGDGKIVVAGYCRGATVYDFCLARYQGDGPPNQPPVGVDDAYTVAQGTTLTVTAPGVLANDSDPDAGTTLNAVPVAGPTSGALALSADGSFTYTPNAGYSGADSFTYRASDSSLESSVVTVTITVAPASNLASIIDAQPNLTTGQKASLKAKLEAAQAFYDAGKLGPACGKLDDFINQVNGLTPKKLDASTASALISGANALRISYGCP